MRTPKERDERLIAIGRELDDLCLSGRLDFESLKSLFNQALEICGSKTDDLEMFESAVREPAWRAWMIEKLQTAPAARVA